jgi:predicted DsbA family dithiol-disulfide isomerase
MFPGLQPKTIDYGTPEGKALYAKIAEKGVKLLPAFLMAPVVTEDPGFSQVQRFVQDVGEYKALQIGAKFDPTAEICDNTVDDDGNGKVDCDDPACGGKVVCRKEIKNQLEVFVMSQCPFGVKALNAMKEVLDAFGKKIDFKIHFIADETAPGQFKALHGQPEVDENIRELCAIKYYPKDYKYMDYILCRNQDIKSTEWQKCATGGIDAKVIEKCFSGDEGKKLHSEDIKAAKDLGIGASPTWLANNKFQFSGIAPEQIKTNFCSYNKDAKGCEKTLTSDVKGPAGGCGSN